MTEIKYFYCMQLETKFDECTELVVNILMKFFFLNCSSSRMIGVR
jgi:hypothetical protein